jgi:hypothetical protein
LETEIGGGGRRRLQEAAIGCGFFKRSWLQEELVARADSGFTGPIITFHFGNAPQIFDYNTPPPVVLTFEKCVEYGHVYLICASELMGSQFSAGIRESQNSGLGPIH